MMPLHWQTEIIDLLLTLYSCLRHLELYEVVGRICRIGIVGIEGVSVCVREKHLVG